MNYTEVSTTEYEYAQLFFSLLRHIYLLLQAAILQSLYGSWKSWKSVNSSSKVFLKDIEDQPDGKIQQLKNT